MTEPKSNRFTKYFPLLLDALRSTAPAPMRPVDAFAWVRDHIDVPEEDMSRKVVNGRQTIFENDVHWARFYLAKAGLIASPKRGLWGLTPAGRDTRLTTETTWDLYVRIRDANRPGAPNEDTTPAPRPILQMRARPSGLPARSGAPRTRPRFSAPRAFGSTAMTTASAAEAEP